MMDNLICHSVMLIGSILALLFVVAVIGGLGLLTGSVLRRTSRTAAAAGAGQTPAKDTLQSQYAWGEINREQYEARKKDFETGKDR